MEEIIDNYHKVEWPKVLASIQEWVEEFPKEFRDECRQRYLREEIERTRAAFFEGCKELSKRTDTLTYRSEMYLEYLEKRLYRLGMDVKIVVGKAEGITPEKIAHARQYPIDRLLKVRHGMAQCPFHRDRHPSMDVRKNFYHCYSCNQTGDVIDLVMKKDNVSFKQAIDYLT